MTLSLLDGMCKKRLHRHYLIFFATVVALNSLVYYPIYIYLNADILLSESVLAFVWSELLSPLITYLSFWGTFAFFLYSVARFSFRDSLGILSVYAVGTLAGYVLQNILFVFIMGADAWKLFFHPFDLLFSLFLDYMIVAAAALLAFLWKRKSGGQRMKADKFYVAGFPLNRFMDLKNPLLKTSLLCAILPSALRIAMRLWFDFDLIVLKGIPIVDIGEVLLMLTYYVTESLGILVGHLAIAMMLSSFYLSDVKAMLRSESKD